MTISAKKWSNLQLDLLGFEGEPQIQKGTHLLKLCESRCNLKLKTRTNSSYIEIRKMQNTYKENFNNGQSPVGKGAPREKPGDPGAKALKQLL